MVQVRDHEVMYDTMVQVRNHEIMCEIMVQVRDHAIMYKATGPSTRPRSYAQDHGPSTRQWCKYEPMKLCTRALVQIGDHDLVHLLRDHDPSTTP